MTIIDSKATAGIIATLTVPLAMALAIAWPRLADPPECEPDDDIIPVGLPRARLCNMTWPEKPVDQLDEHWPIPRTPVKGQDSDRDPFR
ncbi:MAG: hypothetical protein AAF458_19330 [Pseudomonadota bacterium]